MVKRPDVKTPLRRLWRILWQPLAAILMGLLVGVVIILIAGENPLLVYKQIFQKSFFSFFYLMQTLTRAVPITVCAIGIIVAWRAGYINLGLEGQMIVGSFVGTAVAVHMSGSASLVFVVSALCGMAAGAAYALFAAFIYDKFHVSIVISTLMMNYIATHITTYFITFPMRDPANAVAIQSAEIPEGLRLPRLFEGHTFNLGFIVALVIVVLFMFIASKTNFGYESKMTGLNPVFANYGGVKKTRVMYTTMAISGALGACAGLLEIYGLKYRFAEAMFTSTSYAWTGLMSALISSLHPIGAFVVSVFLAGMQVGGQAIQRTTRIPLSVATLIQSSIMLFVSVKLFGQFKGARTKAAANHAPLDRTAQELLSPEGEAQERRKDEDA
jgi:simple sugar transport system permease protein